MRKKFGKSLFKLVLLMTIFYMFIFLCAEVTAVAILINFIIAGLLGSSIPILLNNFYIDPAAASGVFLTACTDAIGFFSFLGLSYFFLL